MKEYLKVSQKQTAGVGARIARALNGYRLVEKQGDNDEPSPKRRRVKAYGRVQSGQRQ